jgi:hypothetical protein
MNPLLTASLALPLLLFLPLLRADWAVGEHSRAVMNGESTVHTWTVGADSVHGEISLPWSEDQATSFLHWIREAPNQAREQLKEPLLRSLPPLQAELKIRITELRSENEKMQKDLQNALRADQFPWIVYKLSSISGVTLPPANAKPGDGLPPVLHTTGSLSLSGTTKDVDLAFHVTPADDGGYLLVSSKTFRMTDFGITPPRALFGLIKAHDEVDIHYSIHLVYAKPDKLADLPIPSDQPHE